MKRSLLFAAVLFAAPCRAHLPSSSTLTLDLTGAQPHGTWSVPLPVLDDAWLLDANTDGKLSDAEWKTAKATITAEVSSELVLSGTSKPAVLQILDIAVIPSAAAPRVEIRFSLRQEAAAPPKKITCRLLAAADPLHRVVRRVISFSP